jgi:hypothetical protein
MVLLLPVAIRSAPTSSLAPSSGATTCDTARFPVSSEFIILPPLHRITENLVSLVDLFEFLLRGFFVFSHIRMI